MTNVVWTFRCNLVRDPVHIRALMTLFYVKNPTNALYMLTPFYSFYTQLHVSALKVAILREY